MLNEELRASFRILELPPTASLAEIREAYRLLSRVWHPDRFAGNADLIAKATARQQELNVAYQKLVDAYSRGYTDVSESGASRAESEPAASPRPTAATASPRAASRATGARHWIRGRPLLAGAVVLAVALAALIAAPFLRSDTVIRMSDGARVVASSIAVNGAHGCAAAARQVWCWGSNVYGERGGVVGEATSRAQRLELNDTVAALVAGSNHSCALLGDGRIQCWGANYSGQLGIQSLDDRATPTALRTDARFASISALAYHTCGVTRAGELRCWGNDTDGQLGVGAPVAECRRDELRYYCSDRPERSARGKRWRAVAAGGSHTCAIDDGGRAHCWGSNRSQQLGAKSDETCRGPGGAQPCRRRAAPVDLDQTVTAIAAGAAHTCALTADGRVFCWGLGAHGQTGSNDSSSAPAALNTTLRFTSIAAGGHHSCAATAAGALYCWGSDARGDLRGAARSRCEGAPCAIRPVRIIRAGVSAVAAGFGSTCVRRTNGSVICWGKGDALSTESPRVRSQATDVPGSIGRAFATVRWYAASIKRFLRRNLVAPLES